jgi:cell division septation protein DedD
VLAIIALIVVFAGVVFFAYKQGLKQGAQDNPPVIRADDSPAKVAPLNPGGMKIPHQDRSVYDRMSGSGEGDGLPDTEHLLPKAEEPIAMQPAAPLAVAPAPTETQPVPASPAEPTPPASAAIDPVPAAPAAPQTQETPSKTMTSSAGGYVAQLAAFRDEASARAELRNLQKKFPSLAGMTADIQKADLGEKGIYYRLRAGYLDKSAAQTLCTDLKAKGQACLVRPR